MAEDKCLRCGRCCHYFRDGYLTDRKCSHLKNNPDGTTYCDVYETRLGRYTGASIVNKRRIPIYCVMREKSPYDIPGCPYNSGKPMLKLKENGKESRA